MNLEALPRSELLCPIFSVTRSQINCEGQTQHRPFNLSLLAMHRKVAPWRETKTVVENCVKSGARIGNDTATSCPSSTRSILSGSMDRLSSSSSQITGPLDQGWFPQLSDLTAHFQRGGGDWEALMSWSRNIEIGHRGLANSALTWWGRLCQGGPISGDLVFRTHDTPSL